MLSTLSFLLTNNELSVLVESSELDSFDEYSTCSILESSELTQNEAEDDDDEFKITFSSVSEFVSQNQTDL